MAVGSIRGDIDITGLRGSNCVPEAMCEQVGGRGRGREGGGGGGRG